MKEEVISQAPHLFLCAVSLDKLTSLSKPCALERAGYFDA